MWQPLAWWHHCQLHCCWRLLLLLLMALEQAQVPARWPLPLH
jgi:hypothetical protein